MMRYRSGLVAVTVSGSIIVNTGSSQQGFGTTEAYVAGLSDQSDCRMHCSWWCGVLSFVYSHPRFPNASKYRVQMLLV